jgi:hypothetical protein
MKFPEDSEFVCVTGWDEALYREALSWVDEDRRVAIISDVERESEDPRVKIYCLESPLQLEGLARKIAWSAVLKKLCVIGDGAFKEELERCHLAAHLILSEAADYWIGAMQNARANDRPYRRGIALKGAFAGVPALIVGAGPCLEKNRHLIRQFEKRALIFAGGSALNAIDVEPHFGASIDAEAPYRQFKTQPFSEVPFCYQSRMNKDNFSLVHGERLLFPDSSSSAINWLHGEEPFDGGWTVGNFLTAIAVHMGCSPIIFVGMDLCYENGRKYAQIHGDVPDGLIEARGAITQRDWLMSAMWTEGLKGCELVNATEGGILRLPQMKLEEVLKRCSKERDLRRDVHDAIQKLPVVAGAKWKKWDASLRMCKKKIDNVSDEVVYQNLLFPLWQIWSPIFEREGGNLELHRKLFFQKVLEEHGSFILPKRRSLLRHSRK